MKIESINFKATQVFAIEIRTRFTRFKFNTDNYFDTFYGANKIKFCVPFPDTNDWN